MHGDKVHPNSSKCENISPGNYKDPGNFSANGGPFLMKRNTGEYWKYINSHFRSESQELIPIPKILILCDEIGYGLRKSMSKSIGEEFTIETIIKPGAYFVNVIEDVVELSMNFGLNDYIIVIAGSNDFNSKKYPSFREINSRIKECSQRINFFICTLW
ncbi:hypothetical protein JTB14_000992 [Gonioctena quinquepunctata]|nr:hypothetical protein JTB14_000992 [Gonioctena quinquepunctata]